jgi:hypothetical protein
MTLPRIALYVSMGALICGLCLLWCWWMSRPQDVDAPPVIPNLSPIQIEFGAIANAEIKRREGWSGKVRSASSSGSPLMYVWVTREPDKQNDWHQIRLLSIDLATRKVLKYEERNSLPDSVP